MHYEKEVDIDNKLRNYLKIKGVISNTFRPQKTLKRRRTKLYSTLALRGTENWTTKARDERTNSNRDEIREKNSRIHWDRL